MRQSFKMLLMALAISGVPALVQAQGAASHSGFRVHMRNAASGESAASTTGNRAGQFLFGSLQPGNYVVEIVDGFGKAVGLSPSLSIAADSTVTVTVGAAAAGALAGGGRNLVDLGPLASVAVAGTTAAPAVSSVVANRDGKAVVCHKISGTAGQTLKINESAQDAHMGHGDTLGACQAAPVASR